MIDDTLVTASPPVAATTPPLPASRRLVVRFTGSGAEYFRIWLLHLLLILLTLGLYLPFAKARRIRYLCANTVVDGDSLAFHGDPKTMFRGFMVLVALFGVYALGGRFSPLAGYVAFLALCVLWPALWRAGQQFRLANTSWRGLRLAFRGDLADAYAAFGLAIWPLVLMVGVQQFAKSWIGGTVAVKPEWEGLIGGTLAVIGGVGVVAYFLLLPLTLAKVKAYQHNHYLLAGQRGQLTAGVWRFYLLSFKLLAWLVVPAVLAAALVWLPPVRDWLAALDKRQEAMLLGGAVAVGYLLAFVLLGPFYSARLQDLVWNHTKTEQLRFASDLRFRRLAWLTAKNWVLTLLSLGLYRPFAAVATWKLKIEAVSIELQGDLTAWDGRDSACYSDAAGEAAGDFFGIDLGL